MRHTIARPVVAALALLSLAFPASEARAQGTRQQVAPRADTAPTFFLEVPALTEGGPFTGRLTVYLMRDDAKVDRRRNPGDAPFFDDPQPMYSMAVENLAVPSQLKFVPDQSFPVPLKDLPAGRYIVQAALDVEQKHSSWRQEGGNLAAPNRVFVHDPANPPVVQLPLLNIEPAPAFPIENFEIVEVQSALLSAFRGEPVTLRAGVAIPLDFDPSAKYPAIYWVSGAVSNDSEMGGDHLDAWLHAFRVGYARQTNKPVDPFWTQTFLISIDTQGLYGHHLCADSDNNGPVAQAIVTELIPAIEKKFPLVSSAEGRIVRGHSSGAWSAIWLAMHHPDVFGAAWATAPDPVDFRAFQLSNIYEDKNMYVRDGKEVPSYRKGGQPRMSVRQENAMERVLGPNFEAGQQWGSWQAVFGPRSGDVPAPLFNSLDGAINPEVAKQWRRYDIGALLRENPERFGPIFRDRIRIAVGTADDYYLDGAVRLLKEDLDRLGFSGGQGYVEIVEGLDHGSFMGEANQGRLIGEMSQRFKAAGLLR